MKKVFLCGFALLLFAVLLPYSLFPFTLTAAGESENFGKTYDLPIVMYHSVLKSKKGKYVVTPKQLEEDFAKYKEMGYQPVLLREVVDFIEGRGSLPQKPMVITFDDGHYNNLYYALPLAKKYGFKIVINVITSYCESTTESNDHSNPVYSCLTMKQIKELNDSGLVEIGNHTHSMHKLRPRFGIDKKASENLEQYYIALTNDIQKAQKYILDAGAPAPITFAYPFGKYNKVATELLSELGFKAFLTCNEGISKIKAGDASTLFSLKRYNRSGNVSHVNFIKKVFGKLEKQEHIYK